MINVFLLCYCFRCAYFSMKDCTSTDACYPSSSNWYYSADHCPFLKIISSLSTYVTCQSNPWDGTLKTGYALFFAKPCNKIQIKKRKILSVLSGLPHLFFLDGRKQTLRPDDCRIELWTNPRWGGSSSL